MAETGAVAPMREAMARKGLSFRTLGFLTDLDPGFLCRVAQGKRGLSKRSALRVAQELEISPRRLVQERPQEEPP